MIERHNIRRGKMNLEIAKIVGEESSVLSLRGEVDVYTAPKLKEELHALVGIKNHEVIIDLANVHYMDSTGLGILIGGLKASKANEGRFLVRNVTKRLERLFSITGFSEVVEICQGEESR